MGNLCATSVDSLLAIRSRRNSLGQEAPDLTFDGTLIGDTGLETIVFQTLLESPVAASSADNPTYSEPRTERPTRSDQSLCLTADAWPRFRRYNLRV